jgi:hypothetical protein
MYPQLFRTMVLTIGLLRLLSPAEEANAVEPATDIHIDLAKVSHTMAAGIGTSLPAIGPTAFWYDDLQLKTNMGCRGSCFGNFPPLHLDGAWDDIRSHARWLGLDFCRVELDGRMYQPARRQFDWDNKEMQTLGRILDYCQANHVEVLLTQMWQDVEWNKHPGVGRLQSAPKSIEDFAYGLATLVEHLIKTKGYTCIRWLSITNEPGYAGCWWLGPDRKEASIMPGIRAVRAELDQRGLQKVGIAGPETFKMDMAEFEPDDKAVGVFTLHNYEGSVPREQFRETAEMARTRGVPFLVSEVGHFFMAPHEGVEGVIPMGGPNSEAPRSFAAQLLNAEKILFGLNVGVDGFNRWSLVNRGDQDGQWQLLRTFNPILWKYNSEVDREPVPFYGYGILTRFLAKHSSVLHLEGGSEQVVAAALRSPKGQLTLLVLNKSDQPEEIHLSFDHLNEPIKLYTYQVTESAVQEADYRMESQRTWPLGPGNPDFSEVLPGKSITAYSTFKLAHTDPGITGE